MLLSYDYRRKGHATWIQAGQADTEDFKQFWKRERRNIAAAYVELRDGTRYIYYDAGYTHKWQKIRPKKTTTTQTTLF